MLVLKLLPVCVCLAQWSAAAAVPPTNGSGTCTNPPKRMEWQVYHKCPHWVGH
ncbi:hypothetical protein HBI82_203170 [Parastagonospora nodorum]|nr:hypothetical protein HBH49_141370 [Parastagonospora nodorum]KAH4957048.1 hypothetical protein HBI78_195500 [Parastagonospora nodorum]KAH5124156.1 hypothetical protein HBH71_012470 [Parastagonospora nodorum]KAH5237123.1 hypothetical protein HBI72_239530 [Parastagonospora nodorum]KAH5763986.1 hypothetical protein HBI16_162870 [Parastagonospora nodorum]